MYSFGELRNSIKRLEELSKSMNIIKRLNWPKSALDENEIKKQPVGFYLQIIHYVLTEYSPELYRQILDMVPNIKTLTDLKFVQCTLHLSRKLFDINPKITAENFLQIGKWTQKRLEFIVQLCQKVYTQEQKMGRKIKKIEESKVVAKKASNQIYDSDDEDLQERQLDVKPTVVDDRVFHPSVSKQQFNMNLKKKKYDLENKQTVSLSNVKANVFPKALQNSYAEDEQQDSIELVYTAKNRQPKTSPTKEPAQPHVADQQGDQPVGREQMNEVTEMMMTLSQTLQGLASKFDALSIYVHTQIPKINARISMLEQNVKIIKDNI